MTATDEIRARLRAFVLQRFPLAQRMNLADNQSLVESGVIDSMGVLELVTFIESEFSLVLADDEVASENFESIDTLTRFLAGKASLASENR